MSEEMDYSYASQLDGCEHEWQPVSFVFESQILDREGRVIIRQPHLERGRVYCVCMKCLRHTYVETRWAKYYLGGPDLLEADEDEEADDGGEDGDEG